MRAIVFDLDGTLIHSAPDIHAAANAMLSEMGRRTLSLETIVSYVGNGVATLVERCLHATGGMATGEHRAALARFEAHYAAAPAALTEPYAGVADALARFGRRGLPLGICTNKPAGFSETILRDLALGAHFDVVVGGDTLPVRKPDPAPLALAFKGLGVAPAEGLYVGDSETDEATAKALGAPFALFTGGYRKKAVEAFEARLAFDDWRAFEAGLAARLAG